MKKKSIVHPMRKENFVTGAYSDALVLGEWMFLSGQGPVDFSCSQFVLGTIEEETVLTLKNIEALLAEEGLTFDDVVKCTVHLSDIKYFDRFNAVYSTYFNGIRPVRTTVESVLTKNIKVEIDCIAYKTK